MSLITCDNDCFYQKDGYCILEFPTAVNNKIINDKYDFQKCIYYIKPSSIKIRLKN